MTVICEVKLIIHSENHADQRIHYIIHEPIFLGWISRFFPGFSGDRMDEGYLGIKKRASGVRRLPYQQANMNEFAFFIVIFLNFPLFENWFCTLYKLSSSAECRIRNHGLRHQIGSRLNARWQTDWAIEDQAKNLKSTARLYDQRTFHAALGHT